jgi:hypothetical protein
MSVKSLAGEVKLKVSFGELFLGRKKHLNQLWRIAIPFLEQQIDFYKNDPYGSPNSSLECLETVRDLLELLNKDNLEMEKKIEELENKIDELEETHRHSNKID